MNEQEIRQIIRDELSQLMKSDRYIFHKTIQILDGRNIQLGIANGTQFGTATTEKLAFYGLPPVAQQTGIGENYTNSVTSGGTNNTTSNYTDLTTYAKDRK